MLLITLTALILQGCAQGESEHTADVSVSRGKSLFNGTCASCHATTDDDVIVGPSLAGIVDRGATRIAGVDAEAYIRQSIVDPRAYTVEGFPDNMMPVNYGQIFSAEDIDAIVAYLETLGE
jgi:cytochrome c2